MRKALLAALLLSLAGCRSLTTVTQSNREIGTNLKRNKTKCEFTTRVYSGVTYDFCRFHAEPKGEFIFGLKSSLFLADALFFSPIMDTVLLPVTVVQQVKFGNPQVL